MNTEKITIPILACLLSLLTIVSCNKDDDSPNISS